MPNLKNAKKALRQSKKREAANLVVKTAYKKAVKAIEKGIAAGKNIQEEAVLAQKKIAKAAKKGVLSKNTAARKIAKVMKKAKASVK